MKDLVIGKQKNKHWTDIDASIYISYKWLHSKAAVDGKHAIHFGHPQWSTAFKTFSLGTKSIFTNKYK
jgi:hypothetical protein